MNAVLGSTPFAFPAAIKFRNGMSKFAEELQRFVVTLLSQISVPEYPIRSRVRPKVLPIDLTRNA